jgi:hypothetical protein
LEVVAAGVSGITYRVSWGIETAKTPEPPKTVHAETRPGNNFRDRDSISILFRVHGLANSAEVFLTSVTMALEVVTETRSMMMITRWLTGP